MKVNFLDLNFGYIIRDFSNLSYIMLHYLYIHKIDLSYIHKKEVDATLTEICWFL